MLFIKETSVDEDRQAVFGESEWHPSAFEALGLGRGIGDRAEKAPDQCHVAMGGRFGRAEGGVMADRSELPVWRCHAWYYESATVTVTISAASPEAAMSRLKALEHDDSCFWETAKGCGDGAGNTTYEIWDAKGCSQVLVDEGHELAPAGSADLLRDIRREIGEFSTHCTKTEYTDTDVVWGMFDRWVRLIDQRLAVDGDG